MRATGRCAGMNGSWLQDHNLDALGIAARATFDVRLQDGSDESSENVKVFGGRETWSACRHRGPSTSPRAIPETRKGTFPWTVSLRLWRARPDR